MRSNISFNRQRALVGSVLGFSALTNLGCTRLGSDSFKWLDDDHSTFSYRTECLTGETGDPEAHAYGASLRWWKENAPEGKACLTWIDNYRCPMTPAGLAS